uniref:ORF2 protein n=1 Tax=Rice tungro spherical virus TaxID=35287 RepID=Q98643_9SECO|nr:ORF2 [Rice tungro spherical virus]
MLGILRFKRSVSEPTAAERSTLNRLNPHTTADIICECGQHVI